MNMTAANQSGLFATYVLRPGAKRYQRHDGTPVPDARGWARVAAERTDDHLPMMRHRVYPSGWGRASWARQLKWPMGSRNTEGGQTDHQLRRIARDYVAPMVEVVRITGRVTIWREDAGPFARACVDALAELVTGESLERCEGGRMLRRHGACVLTEHGYRVGYADAEDWTSGAEAHDDE